MAVKILFVLPSLEGGGAERFVVTLLRHLDRDRFEPQLALVSATGPYLQDLPPDVTVHNLDCRRVLKALIPLLRLVRSVRPSLVFSTLGYMNLAIALLRPFFPRPVRCIAREAILVSENLKSERRRFLFILLYRFLYRRFDRVIAQTEMQKHDLASRFSVPLPLLTVIPNPVDGDAIRKAAGRAVPEGGGTVVLFAAGRLDHQKGFDLLIRALALLPETFRLKIAGTGEEGDTLKSLVRELNLEERIRWLGFLKNPYPEMVSADLFVLSSRYEGFPNVLLEALSLGTPAVAFSGKSSADELIRPRFNGMLADSESPESLAGAVIEASALAENPGGFDRSIIASETEERFGVRTIVHRYEDVFNEVLRGTNVTN